ncbi:hypothetical protein VP01_433g7 [Puccinia sorghi]|uniref:Uncharacterized protein n=1 Tax=Puccinia sorghi TaxID=27349 RepID=A0A0L6UPV9_9BASI|nr:hypothetical protein VP01_433g7 [Puccinia sorghi]
MIATSVYRYLEPYLPSQVVYGISMVMFIVEKFFLPKFYELYSHASLDPKTLVPFLVSAIALYLSIVSAYHAFKAAVRMVWFLTKWSLAIVLIWFILGFLNEAKRTPEGGLHTASNLFQSYQNSASSWWNGGAWNAAHRLDTRSFLGPLQLIIGPSVTSLFEPLLSHLQPPYQAATNPSRPSAKKSSKSSPYPSDDPPTQHRFSQNSPTSESNDHHHTDTPNVREFFQRVWSQTLQSPLQSILREAQKSSTDRASAGHSGHSSRTKNR